MHLKNFPKVRVKEYRKGYVVEIQKKNGMEESTGYTSYQYQALNPNHGIFLKKKLQLMKLLDFLIMI